LLIFHNLPTEWSVDDIRTITVTVKNTGGNDATNVKSGIGWSDLLKTLRNHLSSFFSLYACCDKMALFKGNT
jgi:hypothetical protein